MNKVEKILKGSLDLIPSPSPSVKIQIIGGKVCLWCKGKTLLAVVNKLLKTKSLLTSHSNVLPVTFPANILNFHWRWRWWDQIHAIFLNLFYFINLSTNSSTALQLGLQIFAVICWDEIKEDHNLCCTGFLPYWDMKVGLCRKKEDLGLTSSVIEVHFARDKETECIVLVQYIN